MTITTTITETAYQRSLLHLSAKPSIGRYVLRAESARQSHTLMAFPSIDSADNEEDLRAMQEEVTSIANAIARFEPVHLFARKHLIEQAKSMVQANVLVKEAKVDQLWIRDSGPIYVHDLTQDQRTAAGFNFNYWGAKLPNTDDETLAQQIAEQGGEISVTSRIRLEGGAVEHDGQGTFLATESSIINDNRNPGMSKAEIEHEVSSMFGVTHFIWLPGIKDYDITDYHIDALARFVEPGVVLLSRPDRNAPAVTHKAYQEARDILLRSRDAQGRQIIVHECEEPDAIMLGPPDSSNMVIANYANYLLVNDAVIMPQFGQPEADSNAYQLFRKLFPSREVVQVSLNMLPRAGGGIHCSTQHVPI